MILSFMLSFMLLSGSPSNLSSNILGYNIHYVIPDSTKWTYTSDLSPSSTIKTGWISYIHEPILDPGGNPVKPGISIFYENVGNSADVVLYSVMKSMHGIEYDVEKIFNFENGPITYKNAIGKYATYQNRGVDHKIIIVFMIYKDIGITVFCDSTAGVYSAVEDDFEQLIKSIYFTDIE